MSSWLEFFGTLFQYVDEESASSSEDGSRNLHTSYLIEAEVARQRLPAAQPIRHTEPCRQHDTPAAPLRLAFQLEAR